jgi:hypothetical protein
MQTVKDVISRDGIALARVPLSFGREITRYGGSDHIEMFKFIVAHFPDISSWRILEVCLLTIVQRLKRRIDFANSIRIGPRQLLFIHEKLKINGFRDTLLTLLKRNSQSVLELKVCFITLY